MHESSQILDGSEYGVVHTSSICIHYPVSVCIHICIHGMLTHDLHDYYLCLHGY